MLRKVARPLIIFLCIILVSCNETKSVDSSITVNEELKEVLESIDSNTKKAKINPMPLWEDSVNVDDLKFEYNDSI